MTELQPIDASGTPDRTGPTVALAEFVAGLRPGGIPEDLSPILLKALIDTVGCAVFGATTEPCRIVRDFAAGQGGPKEASLWASGGVEKLSMLNAVLANGAAVHGFDFDDHSRAKIHPGAVVFPVALALAEARGCDGPQFLAAVAAGYEVMNRVSLAADPNVSRTLGWHLTGTTGTFAAAATAGVILNFDARQLASAFGIAGTQSSGLWAFNADGAMTKRLHPGVAARNGLCAALLAEAGFDGGAHVLEAEDGGFLAATSTSPRPDEITRDLGRQWRAAGACFKPYAACGSNHASIDAALALKRKYGLRIEEIVRITVGVARVVKLQTGFAYRRSSVLNAQMSIRYNVAVALLDDAALLEQFTPERMADPALEALIDRIEVEIDPELDALYPERYAGIVTIETVEGRRLQDRVDASRGMPENPMSQEEIEAKFLSLFAAAGVGAAGAETLQVLRRGFTGLDTAALTARLGRLAVASGRS